MARAYTCILDDLDLKNIPQELNEIVDAQNGGSRSIVLIQMIYAMQGENIQIQSDNTELGEVSQKVLGPSVHRLNALVP